MKSLIDVLLGQTWLQWVKTCNYPNPLLPSLCQKLPPW